MEDTGEAYETVAQGAVVMFVSTIAGFALALLTRVLSSKLLTPAEFGLLILSITLLQIAARIGVLGLARGLARSLPRSSDRAGEIVAALIIALVSGAIVGGILVLSAGGLASFFGEPELAALLTVVGAGVLASVVFQVLGGAFRGEEDAVGRGVLQIFKQVSIVLGVVGGILVFGGSLGGIVGWATALFVTVVATIVLFVRRSSVRPTIGSVSPSVREHGPALVRFSLPLMGAATIWVLLHQLDTLFLGYFLESDKVGIYDASYSLSRLIILFLLPAEFLFLPVTSALHQHREMATFRRIYYLTTKAALFVTIPGYVTLVAFGPELLSFVFKPAFSVGGVALTILATGFMVNLVLGPSRQALTATGTTDLVFTGAVVGLVTNAILNAALIPRFGLEGAAIATGVSFAVINLTYVGSLVRHYDVTPMSVRVTATAVISTMVLFALAHLLFGQRSTSIWLVVAFAIGAVVIHALFSVAAGILEADDVALLERVNAEHGLGLEPVIDAIRTVTGNHR